MTIFGFLVSQHGLGVWSVRADLAMLGVFGGFYAVPLNALIQHRPAPAHKGGVIAAANMLSFVGVFLAAGGFFLLSAGGPLQARPKFPVRAILTLLSPPLVPLLLSHLPLPLFLLL